MRIVYLLGTDGAGKTTIANQLARLGPCKQKWRYVYCQVIPLLIQPIRLVSRFLYLRNENPHKDYDRYQTRKGRLRRRRPVLAQIYAGLWYGDFLWQTLLKILWAWCRRLPIVLDRYYLDMVVNQGVLKENGLSEMLADAAWFEKFLPRANLLIYLDVSEATAFARKDDIQSVSYLRERKERYMKLAEYYNFEVVDANQPVDHVIADVTKAIERRFIIA